MDNEILITLARLESGQQEIMRRLDALEESRRKDREVDASLTDRVTRLEERNAFLMKLAWGGGTLGAAGAGGHLLTRIISGG